MSSLPRWYFLSRSRTRTRHRCRSLFHRLFTIVPSSHLTLTRWPSRSLRAPDDRSPGASPAVNSTSPPAGREVTARRSSRPSRNRNTTAGRRFRTASRGIRRGPPVARPACHSARKATLTPMSGRIRGIELSNEIRTLTVAFWRSAVGMTVRTLEGICQSGYASRWPRPSGPG